MSRLKKALADRGLPESFVQLQTKLVEGKPECYTIVRRLVSGSDERGLMYGLLEAAEQIRASGRVSDAAGCPAVAMRGIRYFIHNHDLEKNWYYSREYWDQYFDLLARSRFNRFNLVFAHQTNYLAPPYPFWIKVPEFPEIRVPGLTAEQRTRNFEMLKYISQAAADHGIDFTLGVWEHNIQTRPHKMVPTVDGITRENIGPYSHAALKKVLELCPAIRSVQMRTNEESGIPTDFRVQFYRDYIFTAIRDAGRPVYLDLRAWAIAQDMIEAAEQVGVPLRVSTKYWAEDVGRPYQPAETYPGYSYLDFLRRPRSYQFYWELWGLGSHRLLLWGNPGFVRRAVNSFHLGDAVGFEIDPPLAQKGFGNGPGEWTVFTAENKDRMFWKWEFERYWLFYELWGRLSYNPAIRDSVWLDELRRRFGPPAQDVFEAYRNASGIINEIVAAHLADPNMYIWPEINPGGLLESYRDTPPSDWRFIASIPEAVQNRIRHVASAKQTPQETAMLLNSMAQRTEEAIARADEKILPGNAEWRSSKPDFQVLALLARYHALKQTATDQVAYFDATGDRTALESAITDLKKALQTWERLVVLTDGLYPEQMALGPDDVGHWKDKLPYVRHDLELVRERAEILEKFGRFDFGFDFGDAKRKTVAPRFQPVDAGTQYTEALGYGWASDGERTSMGIPPTPYLEARTVTKDPANLPREALYRDFIRGKGPQIFRVHALGGEYKVHFLHPDQSDTIADLKTDGEFLNIRFPEGEWSISGLVIQGPRSKLPLKQQIFPKRLARPVTKHEPPVSAAGGQPVTLNIRISPALSGARIRLHYRPVNQKAQFKTIERGGDEQSFIIPGEDVSANWDLMYYFEIVNRGGNGWFQPDPQEATPYYVIKVR
jgi:hypothetical protein